MSTPDGPIAVFLDGTDFAEQALPSTVYVARGIGQPLQLVRVFGLEQSVSTRLADHARRCLRGLTIWARRQGVACDTTILEGDPVAALATFVETAGVRYLSIAANGPLSNEDRVSDLVSSHLVRRLSIPVLVQTPATFAARTDLAGASGPIVVPLDGSPLAELAVPEAIYLARWLGLEIHVVHADASQSTAQPPALGFEAAIANALTKSTDYLETVANRIRAEGIATRIGSGLGRPAEFVRDCVQMQDAAMVIMSTRGHSGLGFRVLGHVADAIVREISVPILLIGPTALEHRIGAGDWQGGQQLSSWEPDRAAA